MRVPGLWRCWWAAGGWGPSGEEPQLPTSGKGLPHSCVAASPPLPWAHPSPSAPAARGLSAGQPSSPARSRRPSCTPALSVNFWVNSVSPPDLAFNPHKHESVNRASQGQEASRPAQLPLQPHIKRTQPAPHCCLRPARTWMCAPGQPTGLGPSPAST